MALIDKKIVDTMGCDAPEILHNVIVEEGSVIPVHVDLGLCPLKHVSGKTDQGEKHGCNTSMLGRFYSGL